MYFWATSRAATRPGSLALPLPEGLAGAAAKTVVDTMIARGWLEEIDADIRRREPRWRETGDGHGTTLIATGAGLEVIGIEPMVANAVSSARKARTHADQKPGRPDRADPRASAAARAGTKQARIIALLQRPEGAAISEIVAVAGWQGHTVRALISRALKKKLGLPIVSEKIEGRGTVYKLDAARA